MTQPIIKDIFFYIKTDKGDQANWSRHGSTIMAGIQFSSGRYVSIIIRAAIVENWYCCTWFRKKIMLILPFSFIKLLKMKIIAFNQRKAIEFVKTPLTRLKTNICRLEKTEDQPKRKLITIMAKNYSFSCQINTQ